MYGILKDASMKMQQSSLKGRKEGAGNIIEICLNIGKYFSNVGVAYIM